MSQKRKDETALTNHSSKSIKTTINLSTVLSIDVFKEIFLHLDPPSIYRVKTICKQWNEIISSDDLWKRKCFFKVGNSVYRNSKI